MVELSELWRMFNFCIAAIALVMLLGDLIPQFKYFSRRMQYNNMALIGFMTAFVVGSVESILQHNPVGSRTAIATASILWCLIGLYVSRNDPPERSTQA